jgi:hypothetical protein
MILKQLDPFHRPQNNFTWDVQFIPLFVSTSVVVGSLGQYLSIHDQTLSPNEYVAIKSPKLELCLSETMFATGSIKSRWFLSPHAKISPRGPSPPPLGSSESSINPPLRRPPPSVLFANRHYTWSG